MATAGEWKQCKKKEIEKHWARKIGITLSKVYRHQADWKPKYREDQVQ